MVYRTCFLHALLAFYFTVYRIFLGQLAVMVRDGFFKHFRPLKSYSLLDHFWMDFDHFFAKKLIA